VHCTTNICVHEVYLYQSWFLCIVCRHLRKKKMSTCYIRYLASVTSQERLLWTRLRWAWVYRFIYPSYKRQYLRDLNSKTSWFGTNHSTKSSVLISPPKRESSSLSRRYFRLKMCHQLISIKSIIYWILYWLSATHVSSGLWRQRKMRGRTRGPTE
jgi:hypothetical protein